MKEIQVVSGAGYCCSKVVFENDYISNNRLFFPLSFRWTKITAGKESVWIGGKRSEDYPYSLELLSGESALVKEKWEGDAYSAAEIWVKLLS